MLFIIGCTFLLMIWHKAPSLTLRLRVSILSWISKDGRNKKMRWGGGGSFMQDLYEKVCKNARPVLELHLRLFERCARTDRLVANCQHLYLPVLTSPPHCTQLSPGSLSPRCLLCLLCNPSRVNTEILKFQPQFWKLWHPMQTFSLTLALLPRSLFISHRKLDSSERIRCLLWEVYI